MKSLERVLHTLTFDPLLTRLLSRSAAGDLAELADWLTTADPYRERDAIERALSLVSPLPPDPRTCIEHQLWCTWREAAWTNAVARPLPLRVEGTEWLRETLGHPTMVVAPMTLARTDALQAIERLTPSDRPGIIFGEDVQLHQANEQLPEVVTGHSPATPRRIADILARNGILYTYPDFVYQGRAVEPIDLFGLPRPIASGFVSLAARPNTMLLPAVCLRTDGGLLVRLEEPVLVLDEDGSGGRRNPTGRRAVGRVVAQLLESLIRTAPHQWRLLPTLTFDAPEMAAAGASPRHSR